MDDISIIFFDPVFFSVSSFFPTEVDSSFQALGRFFSDEDIERARRMIPQEERVAIFFVAAGIELKAAVLAKEFGISRYKAERLLEKIRQQKFSAPNVRETRAKPARNPRTPKKP